MSSFWILNLLTSKACLGTICGLAHVGAGCGPAHSRAPWPSLPQLLQAWLRLYWHGDGHTLLFHRRQTGSPRLSVVHTFEPVRDLPGWLADALVETVAMGSISKSLIRINGPPILALGRSCAFARAASVIQGGLGGVRGRDPSRGAGAKRTLSLGGGERLRRAAGLDGERLRRVDGLGGDTDLGLGLADRVLGEALDLVGRGPADRDLFSGADLGDEGDLTGAAAELGRAVNFAPGRGPADQVPGLPLGNTIEGERSRRRPAR